MSKADLVTILILGAATAYAVFGGADFGAGVWQMLAARTQDPARVRARIERSLAPVWEANHTWLIFVLVALWTAFPEAFAAIMSTLYIPLTLAAVGIVMRGAGFAFGKMIEGRPERVAGILFAFSSVITPFFMGTVVGAIATGQVPAEGNGDPTASWIGPVPLIIGVLFVASGAFIAAVFLVADSRGDGDKRNERHFVRCALISAAVAGVIAMVGLIALAADEDAAFVYDGLRGPAVPLVIASGVAGVGGLGLLLRAWRHPDADLRGVRPLAVSAVVAVVWGWGAAQHPYLLAPDAEGGGLKIDQAAAPDSVLIAVLIVFVVAVVVVLPPLLWLLSLADRDALD